MRLLLFQTPLLLRCWIRSFFIQITVAKERTERTWLIIFVFLLSHCYRTNSLMNWIELVWRNFFYGPWFAFQRQEFFQWSDGLFGFVIRIFIFLILYEVLDWSCICKPRISQRRSWGRSRYCSLFAELMAPKLISPLWTVNWSDHCFSQVKKMVQPIKLLLVFYRLFFSHRFIRSKSQYLWNKIRFFSKTL